MCGPYVAMHGFSGAGGRIAAANLPAEYRMLTLQTAPSAASLVRIGSDTMALGSFIGRYAETFTRQFDDGAGAKQSRIKSLYLYSESPGTGKTTTAAALLNEYLTVHYIGSLKRNRQALDRPGYFLDVNDLQRLYNQFNRPKVPDSIAEPAAHEYYTRLEHAKNAQFTVIDDVGVRENCTEGFRGDLHTLIDHRTANGMPSVYTSNVQIPELARIYDKRVADRVGDMAVEISFTGTSNRGMR